MELAFVLAQRQNSFFVEIVEAFRDELDQLGVKSSLHWGELPKLTEELAYVLVPPHEWWSLQGHRTPPTPEQLKRTVFVCAEQPGTSFFSDDVELADLAGGVLDVNRGSVREFARQGVRGVRHAPLGWTRTWSHVTEQELASQTPGVPRDIDVLHLGIYSERRGQVLAAGADELARWNCRLILGDHDRPNSSKQANYTVDEEKWRTLVRTRVLLNVHVADRPYFEWLRIVQTICNGAAVVSDLSLGLEPLEPLRHLIVGRPETLGLLASGLLSEEDERARLAHEAFIFLKSELPFAASARILADTAEHALSKAGRRKSPAELPELQLLAPPGEDVPPEPAPQRLKTKDRARRSGAPARTGSNMVSLISPDSSVADASGVDGTGVELVLYEQETGESRNAALRSTDAPYVCLLCGGIRFYRSGLGRLVQMLESEPCADFAFGMISLPGDDGRRELASFYPWRSDRPQAGNFIDPATLWRRDALLAVGGFSDGPLTDPWRDEGLWRRVAENGLLSAHAPQIVAFAA